MLLGSLTRVKFPLMHINLMDFLFDIAQLYAHIFLAHL